MYIGDREQLGLESSDPFLLVEKRLQNVIAKLEDIELTDNHWEIIQLLKAFYQRYQTSPAMRPLVKFTQQELGENKGNSIYLMKLFPNGPAKVGCKIAGLPRPTNCI